MGEERALNPDAELRLFGFSATRADVRVVHRSAYWRTSRTLLILLATAVLTPVVALVPPHVPWALAVLVGGLVLAWRRSREEVTILSARGPCPRCGHPQEIASPTRLRNPQRLSCPSCHQILELAVALPETGGERDGS